MNQLAMRKGARLVGAILLGAILAACGGAVTGDPLPTEPPPSPTATLAPATPAPSPTASAAATSAAAEGSVAFELAATSDQKATLVVQSATSETVWEGALDPGARQSVVLPPGEYVYRALPIFEPLEPAPCWQSVDEGTVTVEAGAALVVTLYNGPLPDCTPTP